MYYSVFETEGVKYLANGEDLYAARYIGWKQHGERIHSSELALIKKRAVSYEHDVYDDAVSTFSTTENKLKEAKQLLGRAFDSLSDQKLRDKIFEFLNK